MENQEENNLGKRLNWTQKKLKKYKIKFEGFIFWCLSDWGIKPTNEQAQHGFKGKETFIKSEKKKHLLISEAEGCSVFYTGSKHSLGDYDLVMQEEYERGEIKIQTITIFHKAQILKTKKGWTMFIWEYKKIVDGVER